jgi:hypothetical protein
MKTFVLLTVSSLFLFVSIATAASVGGYFRKDGTYVQPHYRSNPDSTPTNNYDFKGNTNPYTGQAGTDPYKSNPKSPYYDGSMPK